MGKRELLLIVFFLIAGVVVYQATAPPSAADDSGFSIGRFVDLARREIRGNPASVETTAEAAHPLSADITELRIVGAVSELQIAGEDRDDIASSLLVHSSGYNESEARQYAGETTLTVDENGFGLTMRIKYPEGRHTGRQRAALTLKAPARLRVRVESRTARLEVGQVAGVEANEAGGRLHIHDVAGRVAVRQRGGSARIEQVEGLKLSARGSEVTVAGVRSDASITMEGGGSLEASGIAGGLDVEARNAEVTLEGLEATRGPVRVNASNGKVDMTGISSEIRVEGHDTELDLAMARAVPATIYSEGDDVALTLPSGGYRLDLVASEGTIQPADVIAGLGLEHATGPDESRASGAVNGGGPAIAIRTTRGDVTLRTRPAGGAAGDAATITR